jgi:phosphomannomutase / phosphoglucomutase
VLGFDLEAFRDCDVRGRVGAQVTEALAHALGRAVGTLRPGARVVVGGDARTSTPALQAALIGGLLRTATRVIDVGRVATPVVHHEVARQEADVGVMVTASHNPPDQNGFKVTWRHGAPSNEEWAAIRRHVASGTFTAGRGTLTTIDAVTPYLQARQMLVPVAPERHATLAASRPLRVIVDGGHGVGGPIALAHLASLGHAVTGIHAEPDGRFPVRSPDPTSEGGVAALCAAVVAQRADLGVAFDGDGDRLVVVAPDGSVLGAEAVLALLAPPRIASQADVIVVDVKASSAIEAAIAALGGTVVRARTGHAFMRAAFLREGARLAGEVSGHYWFQEIGYDDAIYAAARVCEEVARDAAAIARAREAVAGRVVTPDLRLPWPSERRDALLATLAAAFAAQPISRLDGLRITFDEGTILARKSGTEAKVTLRIEAADQAGIERLRGALLRAVPALAEAHPFFAPR